jgi:hypothetical protein
LNFAKSLSPFFLFDDSFSQVEKTNRKSKTRERLEKLNLVSSPFRVGKSTPIFYKKQEPREILRSLVEASSHELT